MATASQVQFLYIAYFGRPADYSGLDFWTSDESTAIETIADGFATTPEYSDTTEGSSTFAIVNSFYENLFGRTGEVKGVQEWVDLIASGATTVQQVGVKIAEAALSASPATTDTEALNAKISAAAAFTAETALTTAGVLQEHIRRLNKHRTGTALVDDGLIGRRLVEQLEVITVAQT